MRYYRAIITPKPGVAMRDEEDVGMLYAEFQFTIGDNSREPFRWGQPAGSSSLLTPQKVMDRVMRDLFLTDTCDYQVAEYKKVLSIAEATKLAAEWAAAGHPIHGYVPAGLFCGHCGGGKDGIQHA